eukprot:86537-Rhodomonas_salina.1
MGDLGMIVDVPWDARDLDTIRHVTSPLCLALSLSLSLSLPLPCGWHVGIAASHVGVASAWPTCVRGVLTRKCA